jgi:pimeloyl-ACP methyl ester carboxylesterase
MQLEHNVRMPVGPRKPTPIVLQHGAWHAAWCYDLWAEDFAANGYETHTFSLPGHGQSASERPINLYGLGDYVNALAQIIESVKPTPFVIAHSLGGFVLQKYLQKHTLPGAVLLCSIPSIGALPFFLRYFMSHPLRFLAANLTLNLRSMVNTPALVRQYFITEGAALSPEELANRVTPESLRTALEVIPPLDTSKNKTPLLVMAGEKDGIFMVQEQKRTAEAYRADFMLIPGKGHNLMIESNWQETAAKIRGWLEARYTVTR